ncbi:hypothetical protein ABFX02_13G093300 [Erythranthe guttata]
MDFETAQMLKSTQTENASPGGGVGGVVGGDEVVSETGQQWGLRPPPPFLVKTFEVVDDPQTNSIISWNSTGTTFIIWDHNKFSSEFLPRLFRTNNLSSFIYQLNNYGFKKVCWERYEYENQLFQAGKKHLLKDIKRRNQQPQLGKRKRAHFTADDNLTNDAMKTKLEAVMNEQKDVKFKIQKLGETLEKMKEQLANMEKNTRDEDIEEGGGKIGDFLKQFMQCINDSEKARLDGSSSTGLTVELEEKEVKEKSPEEDAENSGFWKNVMENVEQGGDGEGVLAPHHSKAIVELEEMMASDVAMQKEVMTAKPYDLNVEEDGLLELWT